ncbi:hypothetical protein PVAND_013752 [Polypedilum vanderplanki]|uniref:Endonuclease/exonuclease/phosphatase domain-containing protein n=1 Tax=Polypedilum vanderplanki TaxID=319348 RepID=A0A9J6CRK7_POLVA|nr:hypothetical protein PVAND_013752 [Polypedilum vanderplanki]
METRFNVNSNSNTSNGGQHQQFPASTFPETFKDFFSMINEDEDHIELVSNVLEDKVIPRYNVRGRNRSSSAKYSNTTSLLPTAGTQVRSNSFRVNRNSGRNVNTSASSVGGTVITPDFCKHIKYCCLHNLTNASETMLIDRNNRSKTEQNQVDDFSDNRAMNLGNKFNDMNANSNSTNFNNYSDDEKTMKLTRKFSVDASINFNTHNKSLQHNYDYDSFETRKCNCENCSASDFNTSGDEFISKLKATNSSYCLMRHNRSINQLRSSNERSSSGASNATYNYSTNSSSTMQDKSTTDSTILTTSSTTSNRKQMELNRQKSPIFNRRRASSITLARTIPNFSSSQAQIATSPAHNPNELYRYMKSDEPQTNWGQQQQMTEQQSASSSLGNRLENREKYTRSKSPNMFNRKAVESSSSAVNKNSGQSKPQQQRARTASMPAENRKPRLADTRRSAIHGADIDMEYYRLRSFSITSHGICNLGDSMRSRRSRSINSVTSSNSGRDRNNRQYQFLRIVPENVIQITLHNTQSIRKHITTIVSDQVFMNSNIVTLQECWAVDNESYNIPDFEENSRNRLMGRPQAFGTIRDTPINRFLYPNFCKLTVEPRITDRIEIENGNSNNHVEISGFKLDNRLTIIKIYNNPSSSLDLLKETLLEVKDYIDESENILILGDFNHELKLGSPLESFMLQSFDTRLFSPRESTTNARTVIDGVFGRIEDYNVEVFIYESYALNHKPLFIRVHEL